MPTRLGDEALLAVGDGKRVYAQRLVIRSGAKTGEGLPAEWEVNFWDPRGGHLELNFTKGSFALVCGHGKAAQRRELYGLAYAS